jgi:hypothetical protein
LPRQFDAGLDRFRTAADEIDIGEPARLMADELFGQRLGWLRGEEGGVGISEFRCLLRDRFEHTWMLMA